MIKFILKQFLYGRFYLWVKSNLGRTFFFLVIMFLIFYFHSEYLKYVDLKENSENNYIGLSFIIKNGLILIVTLSYFYFYRFLSKAKKTIEKTEVNSNQNKDDQSERIDDLNYFLNEDEINRDK